MGGPTRQHRAAATDPAKAVVAPVLNLWACLALAGGSRASYIALGAVPFKIGVGHGALGPGPVG